MAKPQIEDGHSVIANELLDAIIRTHFSSIEHTVFWAIVRKTYGWHKKTDRISYSQLEELTGISRWHIAPALQGLIKRNIIIRQGEKYDLKYGVQKDYELWKSLPKDVTKIITKNSNELLPKSVTKDNQESLPNPVIIITKNSNEIVTDISNDKRKKTTLITKTTIPSWIIPETWEAFVEMRKTIKQPLTDYGVKLIIAKLMRLQKAGNDPNEILNESIMNNWKGVFPLKDNNAQKPPQHNPGHRVPEKYKTVEELLAET